MEEFLVIQSKHKGETDSGTQSYQIEPSLFPEQHRLKPHYLVSGWQSAYLAHLERKIQRNPRDLLSQVRRILLHLSDRNSEAVYGALVDLFLILGPRGRAIRENLLNKVADLLSSERFKFLSDQMRSGLSTAQIPTGAEDARLSLEISGSTLVVKRLGEKYSVNGNPVDEAQGLVETGSWGTAQVILEGELGKDPGDAEVCKALLGIYRKHNLRDAFFNTYTKYLARQLAIPGSWKELENVFTESKNT